MKKAGIKLIAVFTDPNSLMIASIFAGLKVTIDKYIYSDWEFAGFLVTLVVVDSVLGFYKAWKSKSISSRAFGRVMEKVLLYSCALIAGHVVTVVFSSKPLMAGIFEWFNNLLLAGIVVRESLSIFENIAEIKPGLLPAWLMKRFRLFDDSGKLKDLIEGEK